MSNQLKKALSVILSLCIMTSLLSLAFSAGAAPIEGKKITEYRVGDMISFGAYPQSKVKDEATIAALNALDVEWQSYRYTSGNAADWTWDNGSAAASDYMKYCDVEYQGNRYRGVTFTEYRPYSDNYPKTVETTYSYQPINGYYIQTNYWFLFEPLTWRVLDPAAGLVLCELVIDAQPFSDTMYWIDKNGDGKRDFDTEYFQDAEGTVYANNYAESSIRTFLNDAFYNTAFDRSEQNKILAVTRENNAYQAQYSMYNSAATTDKITLLSNEEMHTATYGFSTVWGVPEYFSRTSVTDYADSQGVFKSTFLTFDGKRVADWWLRSAGDASRNACYARHMGSSRVNAYVGYASCGIRPSLNLDLNAMIFASDYPTPVSIELSSAKTNYRYKEGLQLTDLSVILHYSDGSSRRVIFGFSVDGYDPTVIGTQTVTVKLLDLTTDYTVTVSYSFWQKIIRYVFFGWLWY